MAIGWKVQGADLGGSVNGLYYSSDSMRCNAMGCSEFNFWMETRLNTDLRLAREVECAGLAGLHAVDNIDLTVGCN